jgi:hypothetical protein
MHEFSKQAFLSRARSTFRLCAYSIPVVWFGFVFLFFLMIPHSASHCNSQRAYLSPRMPFPSPLKRDLDSWTDSGHVWVVALLVNWNSRCSGSGEECVPWFLAIAHTCMLIIIADLGGALQQHLSGSKPVW